MDFAKSWKRCDRIMGSLSICPAQAGVILDLYIDIDQGRNLSRASGGDPDFDFKELDMYEFVPRKRG